MFDLSPIFSGKPAVVTRSLKPANTILSDETYTDTIID